MILVGRIVGRDWSRPKVFTGLTCRILTIVTIGIISDPRVIRLYRKVVLMYLESRISHLLIRLMMMPGTPVIGGRGSKWGNELHLNNYSQKF